MSVTYSGAAAAPVQPGTYPVSANVTQPGFTGTTTGTLTVAQAPQSIVFGALPAVTTATPPFQLVATSTSGAPVAFASGNPSVATVSGTTVTVVGVGTANIMAIQLGNGDYAAATPVVQQLVVTQAGDHAGARDAGMGAGDALGAGHCDGSAFEAHERLQSRRHSGLTPRGGAFDGLPTYTAWDRS